MSTWFDKKLPSRPIEQAIRRFSPESLPESQLLKGQSINNGPRGRGQKFCADCVKVIVIKSTTMEYSL
jgi:hypothetical protein